MKIYIILSKFNKIKNRQVNVDKCKGAAIISTNNTHPTPYYDNQIQKLYLMPANFEDVAVFHTSMFFKIFKKRKYEMSSKLPIVKISYGNKCIYRRVELINCKDFCEDVVALTYKSMGELTNYSYEEDDVKPVYVREGKDVCVRATGIFCYYWYHPNSATRMSFRIGAPSLIIGIVSLFFSIIS